MEMGKRYVITSVGTRNSGNLYIIYPRAAYVGLNEVQVFNPHTSTTV